MFGKKHKNYILKKQIKLLTQNNCFFLSKKANIAQYKYGLKRHITEIIT